MSITLPRSTPESQGIPSSAIRSFVDAIERQALEMHSFMLVRHGNVVADGWWSPYARDLPHSMFSLSKSFTSTAIGLAIHEGKLSLDDQVIAFFPEDAPAGPSANLQAMKVRHLLCMGAGHAEETFPPPFRSDIENWPDHILSKEVPYEPGTHFVYNSGATYLLSAILQKATGEKLIDYLTPRLFKPLGIEGATWESCPRGINTGGWGLSVKTEDIAKFGQLYLQKGRWNGEQVVPEAWVKIATSHQINNGDDPHNDWCQGYGYQFWRCRHDAYRGDGAFGQFCVVMPEQDAVLAITSALHDMQAVLNIVWEQLLPTMGDQPIAQDEQELRLTQNRLESLHIVPPVGSSGSRMASRIHGRKYRVEGGFPQAYAITFHADGDRITEIVIDNEFGMHRKKVGSGEWVEESSRINGYEQPVASSGVWRDESIYELTMRALKTPYCYTLMCDFSADGEVSLALTVNVSFGPTVFPPVTGKVVSG